MTRVCERAIRGMSVRSAPTAAASEKGLRRLDWVAAELAHSAPTLRLGAGGFGLWWQGRIRTRLRA